jgi:hypothetical protein
MRRRQFTSAERSRNSYTPALVTANSDVHYTGRDQCRSSGGTATRRISLRMRILHRTLRTGVRRSRVAKVLARRRPVDISASVEQTRYNRCVRGRCPRRNDIGSQELWYACDRNHIFQADGFACQRTALGVTADEEFVCPGLPEDLLLLTWSAHILSRIFDLIGEWLIVWQCGYLFGAIVYCC